MSNASWKMLLGLEFTDNAPGTSSSRASSSRTSSSRTLSSRTLSSEPSSSGSPSGSTRTAKLQNVIRDFLKSCLDAEGVSFGDAPSKIQWSRVDFESLKPFHFEQILWELAELNFRFELVALDIRMSGVEASDRQHL